MHATKANPVTYTHILLNYYKSSSTTTQNKIPVQQTGSDLTNAALDVESLLHSKVKAKLERSRTNNYAVKIDADC